MVGAANFKKGKLVVKTAADPDSFKGERPEPPAVSCGDPVHGRGSRGPGPLAFGTDKSVGLSNRISTVTSSEARLRVKKESSSITAITFELRGFLSRQPAATPAVATEVA